MLFTSGGGGNWRGNKKVTEENCVHTYCAVLVFRAPRMLAVVGSSPGVRQNSSVVEVGWKRDRDAQGRQVQDPGGAQ